MVRKLVAATVALLILFHAWLFGAQLLDGRFADSWLLLRWAAAGLLVTALWRLNQQGHSPFWGRRATTIWLLAALLHGPVIVDRLNDSEFQASDTAVVLVEFGSILLAAGILASVVRRRFIAPLHPLDRIAPVSFRPVAPRPALGAPFAPRPPPLR